MLAQMNQLDDPNYGDEMCDGAYSSDCCGASPIGFVNEDSYGHMEGICSECHDHATFSIEAEEEN